MSHAPLVFVILVNWNGWQDTAECIESLRALTYPHYRCVVVDNHSTDDSRARLQAIYPETPLLSAPSNLGFAGGNNVGIRYALEQGAAYVWLLNNDTVVAADALTELVDKALEEPDIAAVGSVVYHYQQPERVQVWGGGRINLWFGGSRLSTTPLHDGKLHFLCGTSVLVASAALEAVGCLSEEYFMYWEDTDFSFRLRGAGWRLAVAQGSCVWHKGWASTGGEGNAVAREMYRKSARTFLRRHAPVPFIALGIRTCGEWVKARLAWRPRVAAGKK